MLNRLKLPLLGSAIAICGALATIPAAHADAIFTVGANSNFSGSGNPTGPFGTITITDGTGTGVGQNGIAVGTDRVTVSLAPNVFAKTGAADTLEFSLKSGLPTLTAADISNFQVSGPGGLANLFSLDLNPTNPSGGGFGGFGIGIICSSCGNGTSPPQFSTMMFDITDTNPGGLTSSSFTVGDANGYTFLVDIGIVNSSGQVIATGYSGATPRVVDAPEPASLTIFGSALLAFAALARWRRKNNM